MDKKDPFVEGFELGRDVQGFYDDLPKDTKKVFEQLVNTNRKEFGKTVLFLGVVTLFSDDPKERENGKKALGFGTSLIV